MAIVIASMHAIPMQGQTGPDPESELRTGINLACQGMLAQTIPHLQAASDHVKDGYAAEFNLALCYVGTGLFNKNTGAEGESVYSGTQTTHRSCKPTTQRNNLRRPGEETFVRLTWSSFNADVGFNISLAVCYQK